MYSGKPLVISAQIALLIFALCLLTSGAYAENPHLTPTQTVTDNDAIAWVQQLGTTQGEDAAAITHDAATASLYLAGSTTGGGNGGLDAWIARYDTNGNKLCERAFGTAGNDGATGIAADGAGNIYVGGYTPSAPGSNQPDGWVARYDANCIEQWVRIFGLSDGGDGIAALDVDGAGNVYLAGWTRQPSDDPCNCANTDVLIAKYNASGAQQWIKKVGTAQEERAESIAVIPNGTFYLTGRWAGSSEADTADGFVGSFDKEGSQNWLHKVTSPEREFGKAVTADNTGHVYATGWTNGALDGTNQGERDGWLVKYKPDGSREWIRQFGSFAGDEALGVTITSPEFITGTVYVAGVTNGVLGASAHGDADVFVARFAANGTAQERLQLGTAKGDSANAITIDGANQVYVAGGTSGDWGATHLGRGDAFVLRLGLTCTIEGRVFTRPEVDVTYSLYGTLVTLRRNGAVLARAKTQRPLGAYSLRGPCTTDLVVRVDLEHTRFDTDAPSLFRLLYGQRNGPVVYVETPPFSTAGQTQPVRKDIIWVDGLNTPPLVTHPSIQANRERLDDLAMNYAHIYEAWRFSDEVVSQRLDFSLPVDVIAYSSTAGVFWLGSTTSSPAGNPDPFINLAAAGSSYVDFNRPKNREWHEFGHHVMADTFNNLMPDNPGDVNHGGAANNSFVNPSTTDSWVEGFAEFYGMAVAKYIAVDPEPYLYFSTVNLESNYRAWNDEEYALAGLLWDLVDPADANDLSSALGGQPYADCVEIPIGALWSYLDTDWGNAVPKSGGAPADYGYIFDVKHLYDVLVLKGEGDEHSRGLPLTDLEELFVAHGFFADVNDSSVLDSGEEIGRSADLARPTRRNRPVLPGSYIRATAVDAASGATLPVDALAVSIQFDPPYQAFNFSVVLRPDADGRFYYYGPDPGYPATTTVNAKSGGKVSMNPLTFTNQTYWTQMQGKPTDSFVQHQFRLQANATQIYLPSLSSNRGMQSGSRAAAPCGPETPTPTPTATPTQTPGSNTPILQTISPVSVQQGQSVQVTIRGANFKPGAIPYIGSTPLQNVSQPDTTTLIGTVPNSLAAGTYNVVVVNPGGGANQLTGGFTVTAAGATSTPTATPTRTPTATPTATASATATPNPSIGVLLSDDFNRADADRCTLGPTSSYAGGNTYFYLPLWPGNQNNASNPVGANIVGQSLQNNGQNHGGVMITHATGACDTPTIRGAAIGQDLYIKVNVLVPKDNNGNISEAGPFLRGRAAARGDTLIGEGNTGYWAALDSTGHLRVIDLATDESMFELVLSPFDPTLFYTVELTAQGNSIQARVSGPVRHAAGERVVSMNGSAQIKPERASSTTDGTVGINFGVSANPGMIGGQRADNLIVTEYQPLLP